jgi:hypothetical protein
VILARMRMARIRRVAPVQQLAFALLGRQFQQHVLQPGVEGVRGEGAARPNWRRLWKDRPLPMISTPSSRSGASARPAARWAAGS